MFLTILLAGDDIPFCIFVPVFAMQHFYLSVFKYCFTHLLSFFFLIALLIYSAQVEGVTPLVLSLAKYFCLAILHLSRRSRITFIHSLFLDFSTFLRA